MKKEFTSEDLANFKEWLGALAVPCPRCRSLYRIDQNTIALVELSDQNYFALTGSPFRFKTHDRIACSNSKCDAIFSYPEKAYNELYLKILGDAKYKS